MPIRNVTTFDDGFGFGSTAPSELDSIKARIAAAEAYKQRMANQGKWEQFAGASTKLDDYYRQRNEATGTNPIANALAAMPTGTSVSEAVAGWSWDDDRGGFKPPAGSEGSSVTVPALGAGVVAAPVDTLPGDESESMAGGTEAVQPWSVYNDPVYLQQLQIAQGAFNNARTNALANKERETLYTQEELEARKPTAEQARRRLAGNFAARGMGGGRSGVLTRAEATQNAQELAARTSLRDKISELNRQFVASYGADGSDWLGTTAGASAQSEAVQAAINARLAGLTTIG